MNPLSEDIDIIRGITHAPIVVVFKNSAGDQVNLQTGWAVFAQVRKKPKGPVVFDLAPVILDTAFSIYGTTGPGRVKIADFTDEQTLAMSDAKLLWDIVLENPDGQRLGPFVAGKFDVATIITEPV
jgi:hypothetical protein